MNRVMPKPNKSAIHTSWVTTNAKAELPQATNKCVLNLFINFPPMGYH